MEDERGQINVHFGVAREISEKSTRLNLSPLLNAQTVYNEIKSSRNADRGFTVKRSGTGKVTIQSLTPTSSSVESTSGATQGSNSNTSQSYDVSVGVDENGQPGSTADSSEIVASSENAGSTSGQTANSESSLVGSATVPGTGLTATPLPSEGLTAPFHEVLYATADAILGGRALMQLYNVGAVPAGYRLLSVPFTVAFTPGATTQFDYTAAATIRLLNTKTCVDECFAAYQALQYCEQEAYDRTSGDDQLPGKQNDALTLLDDIDAFYDRGGPIDPLVTGCSERSPVSKRGLETYRSTFANDDLRVVAIAPGGFSSFISDSSTKLSQLSGAVGGALPIQSLLLLAEAGGTREKLRRFSAVARNPEFHAEVTGPASVRITYNGKESLPRRNGRGYQRRLLDSNFVGELLVLAKTEAEEDEAKKEPTTRAPADLGVATRSAIGPASSPTIEQLIDVDVETRFLPTYERSSTRNLRQRRRAASTHFPQREIMASYPRPPRIEVQEISRISANLIRVQATTLGSNNGWLCVRDATGGQNVHFDARKKGQQSRMVSLSTAATDKLLYVSLAESGEAPCGNTWPNDVEWHPVKLVNRVPAKKSPPSGVTKVQAYLHKDKVTAVLELSGAIEGVKEALINGDAAKITFEQVKEKKDNEETIKGARVVLTLASQNSHEHTRYRMLDIVVSTKVKGKPKAVPFTTSVAARW